MELTKEEKISVINQHIKNLQNNKYNIELTIIEENSVPEPNSLVMSSLDVQLENANKKITALNLEKTKLEA
jgi:hypothetical protein